MKYFMLLSAVVFQRTVVCASVARALRNGMTPSENVTGASIGQHMADRSIYL
jgi:hypothetical protein